jgi:hypothetical protein
MDVSYRKDGKQDIVALSLAQHPDEGVAIKPTPTPSKSFDIELIAWILVSELIEGRHDLLRPSRHVLLSFFSLSIRLIS